MNIHFDAFSKCVFSHFNEKILPSLSTQQKKIILVATIAFSCLAASYFLGCYFVRKFKAVSNPAADPIPVPPLVPEFEPPIVPKSESAPSASGEVSRSDFLKARLAKQLPPNRKLGKAVDNGDCFFDSVAQQLSAALKREISIKDVRLAVHHYIQKLHASNPDDNWVKKECKGNFDVSYDDLLNRIQNTKQECENTQTTPIWGNALIAKIVVEAYQVRCVVYSVGLYEVDLGVIFDLRMKHLDDEIYQVYETKGEVLYTGEIEKWGKCGPIIEVGCYQAIISGHFVPILKTDRE